MPHTIKSVLCIALTLITASYGTMAHAQQTPSSQSALALSPAIIEEVLDPGKPVPFTIQVNNVTKFPLPVKAMVKDFTVQSVDLEKTEKARLDTAQWIKIAEPDFILQPNQIRTVEGVISPPADAVPGGHYATIYFQPLIPRDVLSPSTAYMNSQVGALVFLSVKGDITEDADYASGLKTPGFVSHGPIDFQFAIHNSGNVHIMPAGKLKVYDWHGKQVTELNIPTSIILPDSTKEYTTTWDASHAIGKYRAELEVSYADKTLKRSVAQVWIVPWLELTLGGIIVAGATVFIIKTNRRWHKAWRVLRGKDTRFGN